MYSAGPSAYKLLLRKGYPFPVPSTFRSWLKKIKITPGILKSLINIIKLTDMTELEKVCVLSFDEMKLRKKYLYDKSDDETLKQVVMLRGLFGNWK
jgi:Transposase protein